MRDLVVHFEKRELYGHRHTIGALCGINLLYNNGIHDTPPLPLSELSLREVYAKYYIVGLRSKCRKKKKRTRHNWSVPYLGFVLEC